MSSLDLSGAVVFDLNDGRIMMRDASGQRDERSLRALLPVEALAALCREASGDALLDFGQRIGGDIGRRVASRLTSPVEQASAQAIVDQLGGELALLGLGSLRLELWGRALVFALEQSSILEHSQGNGADTGSHLLAAVIEGAIARGLGREARVLPIARGQDDLRLLLCSESAKQRVSNWLSEGCHYGEALARLNEAGGAP